MPKVFVRLLPSPSSYCLLRAYTLRHFGHALLFLTPWTVACHVSLSVGFSRQEYWSMLPCPPAGDLPDPGVEPVSLVSPALAGGFFTISDTLFFFSFAQSCLTLCDPMDCSPPGPSVHWDSPGKNTGVGCHALLQGIFPTLGSNPDLKHCRQILYRLSHQGSPSTLESQSNLYLSMWDPGISNW